MNMMYFLCIVFKIQVIFRCDVVVYVDVFDKNSWQKSFVSFNGVFIVQIVYIECVCFDYCGYVIVVDGRKNFRVIGYFVVYDKK